ncbi:hypothetical protein HYC85_023564 [Camellia sinensis]|uniref:AP2/ERF domain-containing protein n=1 Tax=Camellia sinensis TaxID=4442 RepID=A0A7J7GG75_CAMSI|nr:hypothetical protein HYC85_023564 [Camellia sinensis]
MGMVTTIKSEMRPLKHHLCSMEAHPPMVVKTASASAGPSFFVCYNYWFEEKFKIPRSQQFFENLKLRAYNVEETAARAYDLAAIKYWGPTTFTNFPEKQWFLKRCTQVQRSCKVHKRRLHMPMTLQRLNKEG